MPKNYTVQDNSTGKKITFRWDDDAVAPTDADIDEIIGASRGPGPVGRQSGAGPTRSMPGSDQLPSWDWKKTAKNALPVVGGMAGSLAAAGLTGGMSIPVQAGVGLALSGGGAMSGQMVKNITNGAQDRRGDIELPADGHAIPPPPLLKDEMLESGLMNGVIPEVFGQGVGVATHLGGNLVTRLGAAGRNAKLIEKLSNPRGIPMSPGAREVGKQSQAVMDIARTAAKDPLEARYKTVLGGPFGQARKMDVIEEHPAVYNESKHGDVVTIGEEGFTMGEVGPTNAARHEKRSNLLDDQRAASRRDDPKAARRLAAQASVQRQAMEQAAADQGVSMDEYNAVSDAWKVFADQFDNSFMKQMRNGKGSNMIDLLTQPKRWKTRSYPSAKLGGATVKYDNPDLIRNVRATMDEASFGRLQTALQKKITRDSMDMHGDVMPQVLAKKIREMIDYGAQDLVPQWKQMLDFAQILDKGSGALPGIPRISATTRTADSLMRQAPKGPIDVGRQMKIRGTKGSGQRIMEWLTKAATDAGIVASQDNYSIPEPPVR